MDMPAYFRGAHPSAIGNVTLSGINIPVRIGKATVMPGDLVLGIAEGVYFIPPALVQQVVDRADEIHIHDEWTRMKFDEGKYKSSEIYGTPRDPALKKEYDEYFKTRLEEIRKKYPEVGRQSAGVVVHRGQETRQISAANTGTEQEIRRPGGIFVFTENKIS